MPKTTANSDWVMYLVYFFACVGVIQTVLQYS